MDDESYTDPELRHRLKEQIQASDKGGRRGQWSARKSQLLVREYERQGGGYRGERDARQRSLQRWGEQDWQTSDGDADARGEHGTGRYLPEVAWALLSAKERRATERPKRGAEQQFVENTEAAQEARKAAELLTMRADEAKQAVTAMATASQLRRARAAEQEHGKGRVTVLRAVDRRLDAVDGD
jgi:hypothetical protein